MVCSYAGFGTVDCACGGWSSQVSAVVNDQSFGVFYSTQYLKYDACDY